MPIPDYQSIMLPLLRLSSDGEIHRFRAAVESLAENFELTPEERRELLPSGKQPTFDNRVGWARTYMTKAGLLISPKRGLFQITERGKQVLQGNPSALNVAFLEKFDEFVAFRNLRRDKPITSEGLATHASSDDSTPEEALEGAYQSLRSDLANEILNTVKGCSPAFFEDLVVDLIVKMGYGGSRKRGRTSYWPLG